MGNVFKIRRGNGVPQPGDFVEYELAYDYNDNDLYVKVGSNMVKVNSEGQGTVTNVVAGNGLTGGGTSTATLDLDFSELTDMTGDISGTTEFILQNGTVESRKAASEIKLSAFNNDLSLSSGTVTSVTAGTGATHSGTNTVNPTINVVGENGLVASANAIGLDISTLAALQLNNLADEDLFALEVAVGGAIKKITASALKTYIGGGTITSVTGMTNNNVLTASGSTTISGESSLQFAGQFLSIQGNDPSNTYGVKEKLRIHRSGGNTDRQLQIYEMRHSGGREFLQAFNLDITTDNSSGYTYTQGSYGGSSYIEFDNGGALKFYNDTGVSSGSRDAITPSLSMWISNDNNILMTGKVGIGWTSGLPARALDVKGGIELSEDDNTIDTNNFTLRRGSSGVGHLDSPGNIRLNIDSNNNQTTAFFEICANASTTPVFKVGETGIVTTGTWQGTAIASAYIADNSINAAKLNVSGNGSNGQVLKSDGDGTFSWFSLVSSSNASTLDNLDSTQFLRSDTGDTAAGNITFTGKLLGNTNTTSILNGASVTNLNTAFSNDISTGKASGLQPFRYSNSTTNTPLGGSSSMANNANWGLNLYSHGTGGTGNYGLQMSGGDHDNQLFFIRRVTNGSFGSWFEMWHSGNDGSGSGLDADTLDGSHASAFLTTSGTAANSTLLNNLGAGSFLRSDANDTCSGAITFTNSAGIYINDANTNLDEGNGDSLRVTTDSGWLEVGSQNSSWGHIQTDRPKFYFNKQIAVDTGIISSYDEDLSLRRVHDSSADRIDITADYSRIIVNNTERFRATTTGATITGHAYATSSYLAPDGSATTPAYRFNNDGNTGMLLSGTDTIGFSTGGSTRFTMNSSGVLYVSSAVQAGNGGIQIWDGTHGFKQVLGKDSTYTYLKNNDGLVGLHLGDTGDGQNYYSNGAHRFRSASDAYYATLNSTGLKLGTGYAQQKLDVAGNVAINGGGATKLYIDGEGAGYHQGAIIFRGTATDASYRGQGMYHHDAASDIEYFTGTLYANDAWAVTRKTSTASHDDSVAQGSHALLIVEGGGDVGIGLSNPTHKLHVNGPIRAIGSVMTTFNTGFITTDSAGNNATILRKTSGDILLLGDTNHTEQIKIQSANSTGNGYIHCKSDGGIGFSGNTSFSSPMVVNYGAVFNETSNDSDFRVESNGKTHAIHVDAGADKVNIDAAFWSNYGHRIGGLSQQGGFGTGTNQLFTTNNIMTFSDNTNWAGAMVINTNITRASARMCTIRVKGYGYGNAVFIDFDVNFYTYSGVNGQDGVAGYPYSARINDRGTDKKKKFVGINSAGKVAIAIGDYNDANKYYYGFKVSLDNHLNGSGATAYQEWTVTQSTTNGFGWLHKEEPGRQIAGIATQDASYTKIINPSGAVSAYFGGTADGNNYYQAGEHRFRNYAGSAYYARIGSGYIRGEGGGSAGTPQFSFQNDTNTGVYSHAADQLGFSTGGVNRMTIGSYGMAINRNANPNADTDMAINLSGSYGGGIHFTDTKHSGIWCLGSGTEMHFGVGGSSYAGLSGDQGLFMMHDNGDFHANEDVIAFSSSVGSDKKFKKNIKDSSYGLSDVMKMRSVEYDWIKKRKGKHDIGVIAQEIEKIIPEVVQDVQSIGGSEGTHKVVDYGKLASVLIKAIQEQQVQIDELKTKLGE